MKARTLILCLCSLFISAAVFPAATAAPAASAVPAVAKTTPAKAGDKKIRAGVLDFTAKGVSDMEASIASDMFRQEMVGSGKFDVLDRKNMESIMKEQTLQQTGCTESACAVQIGKLLNMEFMVYGVFMKVGSVFYISAEMINVETSKIEKSGRQKVASMDKLEESIQALVVEIAGAKAARTEATESFAVAYEGMFAGILTGSFVDTIFSSYSGGFYGIDGLAKFRLFGFDKDVLKWIGYGGIVADIAFATGAVAKNAYVLWLEPYAAPFSAVSLRFGIVSVMLGIEASVPFMIIGASINSYDYTSLSVGIAGTVAATVGVRLSDSFGLALRGRFLNCYFPGNGTSTMGWSASLGVMF
ncbi:MAG: hypothetical protein HZC28_20185 [Spirochaetes bacterium]|nr:hypothetical protein [Spirochaetota bacterium]